MTSPPFFSSSVSLQLVAASSGGQVGYRSSPIQGAVSPSPASILGVGLLFYMVDTALGSTFQVGLDLRALGDVGITQGIFQSVRVNSVTLNTANATSFARGTSPFVFYAWNWSGLVGLIAGSTYDVEFS